MNKFFKFVWFTFLLSLALPAATWATGLWHANKQNTTGWHFMTPDERIEHQRHLRSFSNYEECRKYQEAHHARMTERANKAGIILERKNVSVCEKLQQRGADK